MAYSSVPGYRYDTFLCTIGAVENGELNDYDRNRSEIGSPELDRHPSLDFLRNLRERDSPIGYLVRNIHHFVELAYISELVRDRAELVHEAVHGKTETLCCTLNEVERSKRNRNVRRVLDGAESEHNLCILRSAQR